MSRAQAPAGGDGRPDGSASRPSKNNRQAGPEWVEPSKLPGPGRRPVAVREGTTLRDEARAAKFGPGHVVPLSKIDADDLDGDPEIQARPTYRVVEEWRRWMLSYRNSHIEFTDPDGDRVRGQLTNSYQSRYARRYYARLKDFERATEREFGSLTTVMLTFTASHENAEGNWRCPADHLRDVMDGWDAARKHLHNVLAGERWEYARILEPHKDGYGHLHVAVFVEADKLEAERFGPVMDAHVRRCDPAGSDAHAVDGDDAAVSVGAGGGGVESPASYLAEYLGAYDEDGEEADPLDRPLNEQVFFALTWATNSRRLDFSNGAQEMISREKFRRETGLRPEDRGDAQAAAQEAAESVAEGGGGEGPGVVPDPADVEPESGDGGGAWTVERLCEVDGKEPQYFDPTSGGVEGGPIDGRSGVDPPPIRE